MGYEVTLYVVRESKNNTAEFTETESGWSEVFGAHDKPTQLYTYDKENRINLTSSMVVIRRNWCSKVAMLELGKISQKIPYTETELFFYENGDYPVIEDKYGKKLNQMSLENCLEFIRTLSLDSDFYQYPVAIMLLEHYLNQSHSNTLKVLFYGH